MSQFDPTETLAAPTTTLWMQVACFWPTQVLVLVAKIQPPEKPVSAAISLGCSWPLTAARGSRESAYRSVDGRSGERSGAQQARVAAFGKRFGNRGVLAVRRDREALFGRHGRNAFRKAE
jgi:hypothetical protein